MPATEISYSASDKMEWLDNFLSDRFFSFLFFFFFFFSQEVHQTRMPMTILFFQTFRALNCKTQQNKVRSNSVDNEVSRWTDTDLWPSAVLAWQLASQDCSFFFFPACVSVLMAAVSHRTAVAVQTSLPWAVLVMKRTARWPLMPQTNESWQSWYSLSPTHTSQIKKLKKKNKCCWCFTYSPFTFVIKLDSEVRSVWSRTVTTSRQNVFGIY